MTIWEFLDKHSAGLGFLLLALTMIICGTLVVKYCTR